MKQLKAKILQNRRLTQDFYRIRIESAYLARNIKPGQFVEVRCAERIDPLLRRPFSVHRILKDGIEILYEVVGKGTEILSQRKKGEYLDIIGPLGNGFILNAIRYPLNAILIAGGMGIAPLVALAERLAYSVERIAYSKNKKIYVLIGAKTKSRILCEQDFKKLGVKVLIATEDGSKGHKGLATDLVKDLLSTKRYPLNATLYACGPNAMLKEVANIARLKKIPCQVSLEEYMACGVGVCLGCPVKVRAKGQGSSVKGYEYKMVCKDGPVFNSEEIMW